MKLVSTLLFTALLPWAALASPAQDAAPHSADILFRCANLQRQSTLEIRDASPVQGVYHVDGSLDSVSLDCKRLGNGWACVESAKLGGGQLLNVYVVRNADGGYTAQVFQANIGGKPALYDTLICRMGGSDPSNPNK